MYRLIFNKDIPYTNSYLTFNMFLTYCYIVNYWFPGIRFPLVQKRFSETSVLLLIAFIL
jgi:hypothetical protein